MTQYVGILDGSGDVWGVRIPDVSGCVGGGVTPEAAVADAASALKDVMAHKQSGGFPLPRASLLASIIASGEIAEGESAVMIPLLLDKGRTMRSTSWRV
jgi:predicted RNase H-like HicB family nuclease